MVFFFNSEPAPEPKPKVVEPEQPRPPPPPPMNLVPPLFNFPPAATRTRMSMPAYELMFGKVSRRSLFDDYFHHPGTVEPGIVLKPLEDPHVDFSATMSKDGGEAQFRWQRDLDDPHTFVEFLASTSKPTLQMRACGYSPKYRVGAFGTFPLIMEDRARLEDYGVMGLRYGSENLSLGASFVPFPLSGEVPYGAWLVGRKGGLSAGVQYKPLSGSKDPMPFKDLKNWNGAVSYGVGSTSPLGPSFNFALELVRSKELIASFYQHHVVQRRIIDPTEEDHIIGTTNYVDFGLELTKRVDEDKPADDTNNSSFQVAASWQASKNLLVKGKLGPSRSSAALVFKSWWDPSFTISISGKIMTVPLVGAEIGRLPTTMPIL